MVCFKIVSLVWLCVAFTRIHVDFLSGLAGAFKSDVEDAWMLSGTGGGCVAS